VKWIPPLNYFKFLIGLIAIIIAIFLIKLILSLINPSKVLKIYDQLMVLDLIEYLLRKGKAKWFLKKPLKL
jgi:hypothetical protein